MVPGGGVHKEKLLAVRASGRGPAALKQLRRVDGLWVFEASGTSFQRSLHSAFVDLGFVVEGRDA